MPHRDADALSRSQEDIATLHELMHTLRKGYFVETYNTFGQDKTWATVLVQGRRRKTFKLNHALPFMICGEPANRLFESVLLEKLQILLRKLQQITNAPS